MISTYHTYISSYIESIIIRLVNHSFFIWFYDWFLRIIDFEAWVAFYFNFDMPALVAAIAVNAQNVYNVKQPISFIFHVHNGFFPNFMTDILFMKSILSNTKQLGTNIAVHIGFKKKFTAPRPKIEAVTKTVECLSLHKF